MNIEWHLIAFVNVTMRLLRFAIDICNRMLVEGVALSAIQDIVKARRASQAKDAVPNTQINFLGHHQPGTKKNLRGGELGRAHDRDTLRHHDLIASVRVQVS